MNTTEMVHRLWNVVEKAAHTHETADEWKLFFDFVDAHLVYAKAYCYSNARMYAEASTEINQMDDMVNMLVAKMAPYVAEEFRGGNFRKAYDALEDVVEAYLLNDFGANDWMCAQLDPVYLR